MDKDKEECVTHVENYYCQRLTELVDLKMYDEAHAIFEEFSLGDDESYLNKYGYEYTPMPDDKPTHRGRHCDLDAL